MLKMTLKMLLITPWGQEISKHSVISDFEPELAGFFTLISLVSVAMMCCLYFNKRF